MHMADVQPGIEATKTDVDWSKRVEGTMINPATLHCKEWRPKTYAQHFLDSGLTDGPLAAEAYPHSPPAFKLPFEAIVKQMDDLIFETTAVLEEAIGSGQEMERVKHRTEPAIGTLQTLNQLADSIIHGDTSTLDQAKIDQMLGD